jgi:hypothetical protein
VRLVSTVQIPVEYSCKRVYFHWVHSAQKKLPQKNLSYIIDNAKSSIHVKSCSLIFIRSSHLLPSTQTRPSLFVDWAAGAYHGDKIMP